MHTKDIIVYRGNSARLKITVTDLSGDFFDLSTYSIRFAVYKHVEEEPVIDLYSDDMPEQLFVSPVEGNVVRVFIRPSQLAELSYTYRYVCTAWRGDDDEDYTIAKANLIVRDDGRNPAVGDGDENE